ncbi:MAG: trehalose-phosphatase [Planctomycetes bacterium]|nr:trehalose-phosphatase [Planctomycetota bacterium]
MTATMPDILNVLVTAYRAGRPLALLFDYDGTLTPIVDHPAHATLAAQTRHVLQQLAELPRVLVGILSGRCLDDLKDIVGLRDVVYVGTGGLELEYGGTRSVYPDATQTSGVIDDIEMRLCQCVAAYPGAVLERKPLGLTVHFRNADPSHIEALQSEVARSLESFASPLRILPGPMATEILPDLGWDKGTAVRFIVRMLGDNCSVLYAGDHANDADAFTVTNALKGVTLGIGPDAPDTAHYRLSDPSALNDFLKQLLEQITKRCERTRVQDAVQR